MLAYTTADVFAFVDIPKSKAFPTFDNTRVTFQVRNISEKKYATWWFASGIVTRFASFPALTKRSALQGCRPSTS